MSSSNNRQIGPDQTSIMILRASRFLIRSLSGEFLGDQQPPGVQWIAVAKPKTLYKARREYLEKGERKG